VVRGLAPRALDVLDTVAAGGTALEGTHGVAAVPQGGGDGAAQHPGGTGDQDGAGAHRASAFSPRRVCSDQRDRAVRSILELWRMWGGRGGVVTDAGDAGSG